MNWIKRLLRRFESPQKQKEDHQVLLQNAKKQCCQYTVNPFLTDMRNYTQRVKIDSSPNGWSLKILTEDEIKAFLDKGICWMDYPVIYQSYD